MSDSVKEINMLYDNGKFCSWICFTCVVPIYWTWYLWLEMIQRGAVRFDFSRYLSVSRMINQLGWPMLKQPRNAMMYKILSCIYEPWPKITRYVHSTRVPLTVRNLCTETTQWLLCTIRWLKVQEQNIWSM